MSPAPTRTPLPVVVLVSGQGSNLQAILERQRDLGFDVRAVISDRPQAPALERARQAGVPAETVDPSAHPGRSAHDRALLAAVNRHEPGLVALAGYMRILGDELVRGYRGRLLNVHPSLLPRHRGLRTHQRVLEAGESVHGCSVHFVIEELDAGAVVAQAEVPVRKDDTEMTLRARVQTREHELYPTVIGWYAAGRLGLAAEGAVFDGAPLAQPKVFPWNVRVEA